MNYIVITNFIYMTSEFVIVSYKLNGDVGIRQVID